MTQEELREYLKDNGHEDSVVFVNPDYASAVVGVTTDGNVVYDYRKMVEYLTGEEGWPEESAMEWIDYNTVRALPYIGGVFHRL